MIGRQGISAFSLDVFNPKVMFGGQIGICVMMVVADAGFAGRDDPRRRAVMKWPRSIATIALGAY